MPSETGTTRLMGAWFALGAACFLLAALPAFSSRVSAHADAVTFLVGAILFTGGGLTQSRLAYPERATRRGGLAWRGAWIQSLGTLLFNVMTFEALSHALGATGYDDLVWGPNAIGSACFLLSGVLLYRSAPRRGWRVCRRAPGWWEPPVNLLGCVLFAVSALTAYPTPSGLLATGVANWTTSAGAACFLAVGLAPLIAGMSFKVPRLSRLVAFEDALVRELDAVARRVEGELEPLPARRL